LKDTQEDTEEQMEKDVRQFINDELGLTNDLFDYGYSWNDDGEIEPAYIGNGKHNPK
jgi:hypothetical protein